jgi:nicotinamide-nucleotide amidase
VTYSNQAKEELLHVSEHTLIQSGAVSEDTAKEMAEGALKNSPAQLSIAITGIAGPDGGTKEKPVGTVWFGFAALGMKTYCKLHTLKGDRKQIRDESIKLALIEANDYLKGVVN